MKIYAITLAAFVFSCHTYANEAQPKSFARVFAACLGVDGFSSQPIPNIMPLPLFLPRLGYKLTPEGLIAPRGKAKAPIDTGILSQPKHGKIRLVDKQYHLYRYEPSSGYKGQDEATLWLKTGERAYKLKLQLDVVGNTDFDKQCGVWPPSESNE